MDWVCILTSDLSLIKACMGKLQSVVLQVDVMLDFWVHRSWIRWGQPAVCCWSWATQRCQGNQVSVGAAGAMPEAVHGENDSSPLLCLSSMPSQTGFMLSSTWEEGLSPAYSACVVALLSLPPPVGVLISDTPCSRAHSSEKWPPRIFYESLSTIH